MAQLIMDHPGSWCFGTSLAPKRCEVVSCFRSLYSSSTNTKEVFSAYLDAFFA